MKLLKNRFFWLLILLILTTAAMVASQKVAKIQKQTSAVPPVYGVIPDFKLTERDGRMVQAQDLKGSVWIADFIFTRCMGICPMMSSKMRLLQEKLKDQPGVRLVSFSVDPEYDTPEILKKYAERFSADPQKWFFLTGDKAQIYKLSEQHFYLGVSEIPEAEREAPDQKINHSSKLALIDREGKIRGYYDTDHERFMEPLLKDLKEVL